GLVKFAYGVNLARHSQQELVQHQAPLLQVGASVDRSFEEVSMFVLDHPNPEPPLNIGILIGGDVPERKKIIDDVYNLVIVEESFERATLGDEVRLRGGGCDWSPHKDQSQGDQYRDCSSDPHRQLLACLLERVGPLQR